MSNEGNHNSNRDDRLLQQQELANQRQELEEIIRQLNEDLENNRQAEQDVQTYRRNRRQRLQRAAAVESTPRFGVWHGLRRSPALSNLNNFRNLTNFRNDARVNVSDTSEDNDRISNSSTDTVLESYDIDNRLYTTPSTSTLLSNLLETVFEPRPTNSEITYEEDVVEYEPLFVSEESLDSELISDNEIDETCQDFDTADGTDIWIKHNCLSCRSIITLEPYTQDEIRDLVSVKILNISKRQFGKGHCVTRQELKDALQSDLGAEMPKYIFSVYQKKDEAERYPGDSERGLGTEPNQNLVVQLNVSDVRIYVTLDSAYKLFNSSEQNFYAVPLYGGKRRRIGNIQGILTMTSTNHGQIPGFIIYKLYTREEIQRSVESEVEPYDYTLPIFIGRPMDELLAIFSDTTRIRQVVVDSIIRYITGQSEYNL